MIDRLPPNVLEQIAACCSQTDLVSLAMASPALVEAVTPTLYQCIVVDTKPRALHRSTAQRHAFIGRRAMVVGATSVHTVSGIRGLLETLRTRPRLARCVRSLSVTGNISMSDIVLIPALRCAARNLSRLSEFEWTACPELPPNVLAEFPAAEEHCVTVDAAGDVIAAAPAVRVNTRLVALTVDFAARRGDQYPAVVLPSLRQLRVRPFLDRRLLAWVREIAAQSRDLRDVRLARFLDEKSEVGSSFTFLGRSDTLVQAERVDAIATFFGMADEADGAVEKATGRSAQPGACAKALSNACDCVARCGSLGEALAKCRARCAQRDARHRRLGVHRLELVQIDECSGDAAVLRRGLDLSELEVLALTGRSSQYASPYTTPGVSSPPAGWCTPGQPAGVLEMFTQLAPALVRLELDWGASLTATTAFLAACGRRLRQLRLTVRTAPVRPLLGAVAAHCPALEHLDLAVWPEIGPHDLDALHVLHGLRVLRVPLNHAAASWDVALALPRLKLLELRTQPCAWTQSSRDAGYAAPSTRPSMGLLTGGILDQWDNFLRSPLQGKNLVTSVSANPSLEYVIVDGTLTQFQLHAPPAEVYNW